MKHYILFLAIIGFLFQSYAQTTEFGGITKENLEETSYEFDPTAHSAVLYKKEVHFYRFYRGEPYAMTYIHERIKFYDLLDINYASQAIFLNKGDEYETLESFKAQTSNLEEGNIQTIAVDPKNIKKENTRDAIVLQFDFPDVKSGSIIEYSYLKRSPVFWYREDILCQYDIPIKTLDVAVENIDQVKFNHHVVGTYPLRVSISKKDSIQSKTRKRDSIGSNSQGNFTFYRGSHIPAIKDEPYSDNISNYTSAIVFELDYIDLMGQKDKVAKDWPKVGSDIARSREYRKCLNRDGYYDDDIDQLVQGITDPKEKLMKVKDYIQNRISWNQESSMIPSNGCAKTYKDKRGDSADINLLFVSILQYLDLKAYPVVLSTTDNLSPPYPFEGFFNYVIAAVEFDGKLHFLDISDKQARMDLMALRNYNDTGLLLYRDEKKYATIPIEITDESNANFLVNLKLNETGGYHGTLDSKFTDYEARYLAYDYKRLGVESFSQAQEEYYQDITVSNIKFEEIEGEEETVTQQFDFQSVTSEMEPVSSGELSFYPLSFLRLRENPFLNDFRTSDIYFGYPKTENYTMTIEIPEGYEVEELPSSKILRLPNNSASYKFQIKKVDNKLMVNSVFEVDKAKFDVKIYDTIKEFFQQMVDKQNEQVILKKT